MTKERLQERLQPVLKVVFGENMPDHLRKNSEQKPVVRPVGMIVEDLCRLTDDAWAKYAFSREPLNGKLSDELRIELADKARSCGREAAEVLARQYGMRDPVRLAKAMGLRVDYPEMPQNAARVLFAEFVEPDKVHVYMDGVRKGEALLDRPGVRHALGPQFQISKVLLGHELFHKVEMDHKKDLWTNTYRIRLWEIGPLHNDSSVVTLGEIAAMAFTQALNGLNWSPYVLDAYLVYGYSPQAASALYEEMMGFADLTPRIPAETEATEIPKNFS